MKDLSPISIRPNLNAKGQITVHNGKLGQKWFSIEKVSIYCESTTVRPSGQRKAEVDGEKTVHAGLNGHLRSFCPILDCSLPLTYNPHKGDKSFYIELPNGEREAYTGGGIVTMIGWKAWLICRD